jgi:hypothetical protein
VREAGLRTTDCFGDGFCGNLRPRVSKKAATWCGVAAFLVVVWRGWRVGLSGERSRRSRQAVITSSYAIEDAIRETTPFRLLVIPLDQLSGNSGQVPE